MLRCLNRAMGALLGALSLATSMLAAPALAQAPAASPCTGVSAEQLRAWIESYRGVRAEVTKDGTEGPAVGAVSWMRFRSGAAASLDPAGVVRGGSLERCVRAHAEAAATGAPPPDVAVDAPLPAVPPPVESPPVSSGRALRNSLIVVGSVALVVVGIVVAYKLGIHEDVLDKRTAQGAQGARFASPLAGGGHGKPRFVDSLRLAPLLGPGGRVSGATMGVGGRF